MSLNNNNYSIKKRRYRNNNYNVDFKLYEYKLADTQTISEEIANECTNIEKKGGEVLSIIYNTYPLLNNKVYSNFLIQQEKKKGKYGGENNKYIEDEENEETENNRKKKDDKKEEHQKRDY